MSKQSPDMVRGREAEAAGAATPARAPAARAVSMREPARRHERESVKDSTGVPAAPDRLSQVTAPASPAETTPVDLKSPELYLNRELTWLSFNRRVLHEARDPRNPLLERVKFL